MHRHGFSSHGKVLPFTYQLARTVTSAGGARKVIDEQKKDEQKDKQKEEEPKSSDTKFDRSLKARKAKNTEHQSVIAHMSDVRTPRSLLKSSEKLKWEVSLITILRHRKIHVNNLMVQHLFKHDDIQAQCRVRMACKATMCI